jgi:hypothetical protein
MIPFELDEEVTTALANTNADVMIVEVTRLRGVCSLLTVLR